MPSQPLCGTLRSPFCSDSCNITKLALCRPTRGKLVLESRVQAAADNINLPEGPDHQLFLGSFDRNVEASSRYDIDLAQVGPVCARLFLTY
jgi:hypothetical protein